MFRSKEVKNIFIYKLVFDVFCVHSPRLTPGLCCKLWEESAWPAGGGKELSDGQFSVDSSQHLTMTSHSAIHLAIHILADKPTAAEPH